VPRRMRPVIVLGVESSCDETAAAVVRDDGLVLSEVIATQVKLHAPYGGVVPELAARAHIANVAPVIQQALAQFAPGLSGIDAVAVTQGPGLVSALLIGTQAGKAIAFARGIPVVGVNHLVGHLLAVFLRRAGDQTDPVAAQSAVPSFPFIALLVSGGHTALYEVRSPSDMEQLGQTRDDAAGEAFDKVAKLIGLGYPGGPLIDRLAAKGNPRAVKLPMPLSSQAHLDFSFSGLKSAVARHVAEHGVPPTETGRADLAASFQRVAVEVLVRKSVAACVMRNIPRLVLTGGVAANRGLRARAAEECSRAAIDLFVPPPVSCTDNAAMIAYAGACQLRGGVVPAPIEVFSRGPILGATPGSPALRRFKSSRLPRARTGIGT